MRNFRTKTYAKGGILKAISLLLTLVLIMSFSACSGAGDSINTENTDPKTDTWTQDQDRTEDSSKNDSGNENGPETGAQSDGGVSVPDSRENITEARSLIWNEYLTEMSADSKRMAEFDSRAMEFGDVKMKYGMQIKGDPGENGYPVYIALHGGGGSDTPDINDSQWADMALYYQQSVKSGIYINPRGVRDTWDCHANPESYPLYDELIENMIIFKNADPNRVYILGFSAGGDGVYLVAPRMADRFAAANMSAGHPNGTSVVNLYNTPIQLQVGLFDDAYDRNRVTAEYDAVLAGLGLQYGGGYTHRTFIHANYAHNFYDNKVVEQEVLESPAKWLATGDTSTVKADTNAVRFLEQYTRDPLPKKVIWDLSNRADMRSCESFYWLRAPYTTNDGIIVASYDTASNTVTIESSTVNGDFSILLNEEMVDVFKPVTFVTPDGTFTKEITPDIETIRQTTYERGDKNYQFCAVIAYSELK